VAYLAYEQLISYVKTNISNGYSAEAIRQVLIGGGYPSDAVEYSISQALAEMNNKTAKSGSNYTPSYSTNSYAEKSPATQQTASSLTQYVSEMLIKGYTPDVIKSYLMNQGYSIGDVQSAIDAAKRPLDGTVSRPTAEIKHTISFSGNTIIALFLIFAILSGVGFFTYKFNSDSKLLDYAITIDLPEVKPGESLAYTDKFANFGTTKSYDITVEHSIESKTTNQVVDSWKETVAIDRLENTNGKIKIGNNVKPGEYILKGLITYDGKEATASDQFTVLGDSGNEPSCIDKIKNQGETKIDCGGPCQPCIAVPTCTDGFRNQDETGIDCGGKCKACPKEPTCIDKIKNQGETGIDCGGPCPKCLTDQPVNITDKVTVNIGDASLDYDKITKVEQMGKTDESGSLQICKSVVQDRKHDDCFIKLSTIFNASKYCKSINASTKRDVCYMYFVNQRDYSVCEDITQPYTKRACISLQQVNKYYDASGMPTTYAVLPAPKADNATAVNVTMENKP
jgi:hypothetical protein